MKIFMRTDQQTISPTIRTNNAVLTPFIYGHMEKHGIYGLRDSVYRVVRSHEGPRTALFNSHPEWYGIIFRLQPVIKIGGTAVPSILIAVVQKMFHQLGRLPVFWIIPLQYFDKRQHEGPIKKRILPITLFRSSPARVSS